MTSALPMVRSYYMAIYAVLRISLATVLPQTAISRKRLAVLTLLLVIGYQN